MKLFKIFLFSIISLQLFGQCSSPCCCFSDLSATITADEDICLPVGTTSVNRTITVNVSGGVIPYTYAWDISPTLTNPGNVNSATFTLTETTVFTVTVTDFDDCGYIVSSTVTIDNAPDASLTDNTAYLCVPCGTIATINLTTYVPLGVTGQWYQGDQVSSCASPINPVVNPSNVTIVDPFTQFTFGVAGSGVCAGQQDCSLLDVYYNIDLNIADISLSGNVCDDATVDILLTDTGGGSCFTDWTDWNNTTGIVNEPTLNFPTGVGETPITDGNGNITGWTFPATVFQNTSTTVTVIFEGEITGDPSGLCTNESIDLIVDGTGCCSCDLSINIATASSDVNTNETHVISDAFVVQECGGGFQFLIGSSAPTESGFIVYDVEGCGLSPNGAGHLPDGLVSVSDAEDIIQDRFDAIYGVGVVSSTLSGSVPNVDWVVSAPCDLFVDISVEFIRTNSNQTSGCTTILGSSSAYIVDDPGCCN